MKEKFQQISINSDAECSGLIKEIQKRSMFQKNFFLINTCIFALFVSLSLLSRNNYLVLLIPFFELLAIIVSIQNHYATLKTIFYLNKTYQFNTSSKLGLRFKPYAVYCAYAITTLLIGIVRYDHSLQEETLLIVDIISLVVIIFLTIFLTRRCLESEIAL